jgi:hypothetical protein
MTTEKVTTLGGFLDYVRDECRGWWRLGEDKELWFRGEGRDHQETLLRPELYRPRKGRALRAIDDLLDIESDLYEEFQRCADQFRGKCSIANIGTGIRIFCCNTTAGLHAF